MASPLWPMKCASSQYESTACIDFLYSLHTFNAGLFTQNEREKKKINFLELSDTGILNIDCHRVSMLHYMGRMKALFIQWAEKPDSKVPVLLY